MSGDADFGPWIEHDATPCPLPVGTWVQVTCRFRDGSEELVSGRVNEAVRSCPSWVMKDHMGPWSQVIRYRIRRPRSRAVDLLREIARDPHRELEDA